MNTKILASASLGVLAAIGLSGCPKDVDTMDWEYDCTDSPLPPEQQKVQIRYGDSHISVNDIARVKKVKRNQYLVFKLFPDQGNGPPPENVNFKRANVAIVPEDAAQSWLAKSGNWEDDNKELRICVPKNVDNQNKTYKYIIEIEDVGELDPRVIVEPS
jgi:hypothetical protein